MSSWNYETVPILVNIFVILSLILYVSKRNSTVSILMAIFSYLTLHYSFSFVSSLLVEYPVRLKVLFHEGYSLYIKLNGMLFVGSLFVFLVYKNKLELKRFYLEWRQLLLFVSILIIFFLVLGIIELSIDRYKLNINSAMALWTSLLMWVFSFLIAALLYIDKIKFKDFRNEFVYVGAFLLLLQLLVGAYEVFTGTAYAGSGASIRASGVLFNPNVLGLWTTFAFFITYYLFLTKNLSIKATFVIMAIISLLFILCSSRSMLIVCITSILFMLTLLRDDNCNKRLLLRNRISPLLVFMLSLSFLMSLFKLIFAHIGSVFFKILAANSNRILNIPHDVLIVFGKKISSYHVSQDTLSHNKKLDVSGGLEVSGTETAILGRITRSENVDSTYLYLESLVGVYGLGIWLLLFALILWIAIKKYRKTHSVNSVFSVGIIFCVLLSGVFMRTTQLFPMSIFMSIFLGISIYWSLEPLKLDERQQ